MEIVVKSTTEKRDEVKKLLSNMTKAFLDVDIAIDSAAISGKKIRIICSDPKKAFKIVSKIFGVSLVSLGEKESVGVGGNPVGAKGSVCLDMKNKKLATEILNRKGVEVDCESEFVATESTGKHKQKGIFAFDPLFGVIKEDS